MRRCVVASMKTRILLGVLGLTSLHSVVRADLPVHCLHWQTVGEWELKLGSNDGDSSLRCGHDMPDRVMTMPNNNNGFDNPGFEVHSTMKVALTEPDKATDEAGNRGFWTLIYDEGMEIRVGGKEFFAFFKYVPRVSSPRPDKVEDFNSVCSETYAGWYHNPDKTHWGCFVARKVSDSNSDDKDDDQNKDDEQDDDIRFRETSVSLTSVAPAPAPQALRAIVDEATPAHGNPFAEVSRETAMRAAREAEAADNAIWENDLLFIELVNSDPERTWNARAHPEFEGQSITAMKRMLGVQTFGKDIEEAAPQGRPSSGAVGTPFDGEAMRFRALPTDLDWRKEAGGAYATPVVSQGSCGSCYAIAGLDVATIRLRIVTKGRDRTVLSPMNAMACSAYNQGCDGGYPFLVGKHGADIGFVPSSCQRYDLSDQMVCRRECLRDHVYRARNYHYVGGFYGACSEESMMRELLNGPIVVALNAPPDLFYYAGGVYSYKAVDPRDRDINGISRWERTNHAVICVGWGEEVTAGGRVQKYWILKNSWGASWGENGYFRLARGNDEVNAESMAVAFDMISPDEHSIQDSPRLQQVHAAASVADIMNVGSGVRGARMGLRHNDM